MNSEKDNQNKSQPGFEPSDLHARGVWYSGLGLAIGAVLVACVVMAMFNYLRRAGDKDVNTQDVVAPYISASGDSFPKPRLQVSPEADLAAFRKREDDQLSHYGWIDKNAGTVRLPVTRAMDLIAQRGLPFRGQPGAPIPTRTFLDFQKTRPGERATPTPQ